MDWRDASIPFGPAAEAALREHWAWLIGERWEVVLASAIGDVFLSLPSGSIWWLSTATGDLAQVAEDETAFRRALDGDQADEWFLPGLVAALREAGHRLGAGECYAYGTLPVFAEGSFSVENMRPTALVEHLRDAGAVLRAIRALPDGTRVELRIAPPDAP